MINGDNRKTFLLKSRTSQVFPIPINIVLYVLAITIIEGTEIGKEGVKVFLFSCHSIFNSILGIVSTKL